MNARQAVDGEVAALRREVAALRASSNGHTVDPDEIKRLKKEHKAALKAALRDGGSSSEREKEELMAAMEREVEQARSRRPFTPSTRLVAIARCRGWFIFLFSMLRAGRRRGARALRQGAISVGEGAPQGEEGLQSFWPTINAIERSSEGREERDTNSEERCQTHPQRIAPAREADLPCINEAVRQYGPRGARGETEIPQGVG